ncbi:hypothetical protein LOTGIDRAFT_173112 [Lottia gigantea]|uniref:Cytochrome P450 n=1 Tax=Lottia gigantea TaxID=225164 RepID=V4B005_LOTGI|nr:hypothetical protein LOTGIDRAFT_173112 [Lottia gigantea]ESP00756.1 hypothetical protein LOTGIDRAFT_173112 [Lottia gigantea]
MDFLFLINCVLAVIIAIFIETFLEDLYYYHWIGIPPGPWSLPIIGTLQKISPKTPHHSFTKFSEKFGKILSLKIGLTERIVYVTDMQLFKDISYSKVLSDRPCLYVFDYLTKDVEGVGSAVCNSAFIQQKQLLIKAINNLSQTSLEIKVKQVAQNVIKRYQSFRGEPAELKEMVLKFMVSQCASLVYGIDSNDPIVDVVYTDHRTIMKTLSPFHPLNLLKCLWWFPNPWTGSVFAAVQRRDEILTNKCYENLQFCEGNGPQLENLIHLLIADHKILNPKLIKNLIMTSWTVFLAGSDTLYTLYLWSLLYLGLYPDVQDKLYKEIISINPSSLPKLEQKPQYHYTGAFIQEMMRICQPNVLGIPHCAAEDTQIGGYNIQKGTSIMIGFWEILNSEEHWQEARKFKPERFLDENGHLLKFVKFPAFIAFGKGIRMCPGTKIAVDIMFLLITSLLKCLSVKLHLEEGETLDIDGRVVFGLEPPLFKVKLLHRLEDIETLLDNWK